MKLQTEACNFIKKEALAQLFSCELCKAFTNNFFYRTHLVAASVLPKYTIPPLLKKATLLDFENGTENNKSLQL